jgi:hypothetical protein
MEANPFCEHCGTLFPAENQEPIECETHADRLAAQCCIVCGRSLCKPCTLVVDEKNVCADPLHGSLARTGSILLRTSSEYESDAVIQNLAQANVAAYSFCQSEYIALRGFSIERNVVWVANTQLAMAQQILEKLNLI